MKKFLVATTMAFILTGSVSIAMAGDGSYVQEKVRLDTEKRMAKYEQEKASVCCPDVSEDNKTTKTEKTAATWQSPFDKLRVSDNAGGK